MRENLVRKIDELPPELQTEIENFVEFLWVRMAKKKHEKPSFSWAGALKGLAGKYTSVELQHKISDWRMGE
jgi:hypothetical protein